MTTDAPNILLKDLTAEQRMRYVEHQIFEMRAGRLDTIECPYCAHITIKGEESLCCALMADAVTAVLFKIECADQLDKCARIADNAATQHIVVN
jgi:hypothetical protein